MATAMWRLLTVARAARAAAASTARSLAVPAVVVQRAHLPSLHAAPPRARPLFGWLRAGAAAGAVAVIAGLGAGAALAHEDAGSTVQLPRRDMTHEADQLCAAIAQKRSAEAEELVRKNPQLAKTRTEYGWTALHVAVVHGDVGLVNALLAAGADPNAADLYGADVRAPMTVSALLELQRVRDRIFGFPGELPRFTPLHYACLHDATDLIEPLLRHGANPDEKVAGGARPIDLVSEQLRERVQAMMDRERRAFQERHAAEEKRRRREFPLERVLEERIVGQTVPIHTVAAAIRRKQNGWHDEDKPLVFLFLGSSGIGKTELAKQVARYMHGDKARAFIRVDMSEYQSQHEVAKLIGAPPGYVGYSDGGQLTKQLREFPNAVVLFDEIEKAHPDVLTVMLQLFDEGRLTDGQGETIDCKEAIFIMTSNLAQSEIAANGQRLHEAAAAQGAGGAIDAAPLKRFEKQVLYPILKAHFGRDEFLGRINETVVFLPFTPDELQQLATLELQRWARKATERHGIAMSWTADVVAALARGYNINYGARSIKHECDRLIINPIARAFEHDDIKRGSKVSLYCDANGNIRFRTA